MEILVLAIGDHRFGVNVDDVRGLLRAVSIRPVPGAPTAVEGIIDVHGELVPALDLRARFGLPRRELTHTDHMVLTSDGRRTVVVRADRALGIVPVDPTTLLPGPAVAPGVGALAGVVQHEGGILLIQDLHAFLSQIEEQALDRALSRGDEA